MKLTKALRKWLQENMSVKDGSDDDTFKKAAGEAFATGQLSAEKYTELWKTGKTTK